MSKGLIPVTILTGFLGSGKTTLLNHILKADHGHRIAVIENEFGEAGIDNELLVQDRDEQIVEMNNGCICCTVRGDLVRILGELAAKRKAGTLAFDRVIIETTGLADPAPVAQTFFVDEDIGMHYLLDAIVTLVDAVHAPQQFLEHHEAQEQVGFADRILLTKTDLVSMPDILTLKSRLQRMNPRAPILESRFGNVPLEQVLDLRGFNLNAILEIEPDFLSDVAHEHDDDVTSFVFREDRPLDLERLEDFLGAIVQVYGTQLMRYKGILYIKGQHRRIVFQGVHMLMGTDLGAPWREGEARESRMVFIGKNMPQDVLLQGLQQSVAQAQAVRP
ncbi:MAG: GTP-binding protein [Hydrogenophaga sp.]|uniref:CobW family GTP-binding protein n=1 Tax=Hydrogenophaga sp. TaxID=1904254 RepID=UPI0027787D18|nr:GTP-binding protein [Hydrogenophaga sp.]MDP2416138.1 GTP-binding protein [Hydrogenophaga sp.]MDZ4187309.1 GTP-binding protein [Hydrogenophaga sp.]